MDKPTLTEAHNKLFRETFEVVSNVLLENEACMRAVVNDCIGILPHINSEFSKIVHDILNKHILPDAEKTSELEKMIKLKKVWPPDLYFFCAILKTIPQNLTVAYLFVGKDVCTRLSSGYIASIYNALFSGKLSIAQYVKNVNNFYYMSNTNAEA